MATIPIAGGRASGGSSYTATSSASTEANSFDEKLARELTSGDIMSQGDSTAAFGTQAHFNSLGLTGKDDVAKLLSTVTYGEGLDGERRQLQLGDQNVSETWKEVRGSHADDSVQQHTGYAIGNYPTGTKKVVGHYLVDQNGKLTGLDYSDTSWKSAVPALAMLLGPLAGALAPGFANAIGAATGMGSTAANIAARGLLGGGMSLATGGKFGHGLIGGAVTAGLNPAISGAANTIAGQGTTAASLLAGAGRLGLTAAMNGGNLSPMSVVSTLVDSMGNPKGKNK